MTCPHGKCDGSGLIPLRDKAGEIVPYAWVYCRCSQYEHERYFPATPDIIDFPVSWDWYRYYCWHYGWPDHGPNRNEESPRIKYLECRIGNLEAEFAKLKGEAV